jgi:hypothetical protein
MEPLDAELLDHLAALEYVVVREPGPEVLWWCRAMAAAEDRTREARGPHTAPRLARDGGRVGPTD